MKLGRLGILMQENGVTASQLNRETGCNMTTIHAHKYDLEEWRSETLITFAKYFGVTTDWPLGLTDKRC